MILPICRVAQGRLTQRKKNVKAHIPDEIKTSLDANGESLVCRARKAEHGRVLVERFKRRVYFD
jgi:hypothetical protein